jgi:hypothetical protein
MSWGDSWGSSPCHNATVLAKAFYEGRERTFGQSRVEFHRYETRLEYLYKGAVIAWYTPESIVPRIVADKLLTGEDPQITRWPLQFRCHYGGKGEARHLRALGLEAKWQWGGRPMLVFGVDGVGEGWHTIEEWKALPKWVEPPKVVKPVQWRREPFVNLTLPLFA